MLRQLAQIGTGIIALSLGSVADPGHSSDPGSGNALLPGTNWTIHVVDDAGGTPITGAWVVAASQLDHNEDGALSAPSGFTGALGQITLNLPADESFPLRLHVAAPGYGAFMGRYLRPSNPAANPVAPVTIRLINQSAAQLFWGQLAPGSGSDLGGVAITTRPGMTLPDSLTSNQGKFAFSVDRESLLDLIISGPSIEYTSWTVDPLDLGTYSSPTTIPVNRVNLLQFDIHVTAPTGGIPLSSDLEVFYARASTGDEPNREWKEATPVGLPSLGNFQAIGQKSEPFHLFAIDQGLWGHTQGATLSDGQPTPIALEDPGQHGIQATVFTASLEGTHKSGTVELWWHDPDNESKPYVSRVSWG